MKTIEPQVTGRKVGAAKRVAAIAEQIAPTSVDPEELLDVAETAQLLRHKEATLATWRCEGRGPEYVKIGRSIFYRRAAISSWLARQIVRPDAA
ncbi:helix-turn-helix domain-containing protein [Bradyrhizobium sp. SZCCHNS3004]|uniref:helix-turn-helix domain-containing protein n=1 Tax=Bradyrhizobium sp. SZCCHNS3004 TaxID=3057312 RepID=UPI002915EE27|nr:helix-turn-helix domain-containing protein [Bradyrhizobium sp. SZCCHNS3004]